MNDISRRLFLGGLSATALGGCTGIKPPAKCDEVRFAAIGAMGMGQATSNGLIAAGAKLVALCDANRKNLEAAAKKWPGLPCYTDYRKMLKEIGDAFNAVQISTPDHTHAYIAVECMNLGKHVYLQKPLARTFEECEILLAAAKRTGVVTQMGNQGHPGVVRYDALKKVNFWGDVKLVESWSDRPGVPDHAWWPQGMKENMAGVPYDDKMGPEEWNCWLGPAKDNGYNPRYFGLPWRGWCDYGCGAIGDMAVHNADPAFWTFNLGLPVSLVGDTNGTGPVTVAYPKQSRISMRFDGGIEFKWYDGGLFPEITKDMRPGLNLGSNGLLVRGSRATTLGGSHASPPVAVAAGGHEWNEQSKALAKEAGRILHGVKLYNHYEEFVKACLEGNPEACGSKFSYAARLTEALLLGCVSLRYPGVELRFDPIEKRFVNNDDANKWLLAPSRGEWDFGKIRNGRPWWSFLYS